MNIAEILKDCPKGTKLWSPLCGDCILHRVTYSVPYSIEVYTKAGGLRDFTAEGRYLKDEGECLLFPSKENRDWTKFHQYEYKPGDFVYFKTEYDWICLFKESRNGMIYTFLSYDPETQGIYGLNDKWNRLCSKEEIKDSRLATEQEKTEVLQALDREGYFWDAENLKLVKKPQFKPFDKVLVRDNNDQRWRCTFFSHLEGGKLFQYITADSRWKQCIPYKGNEHLVGTTENVK